MKKNTLTQTTSRRGFLVATGAATLGLAAIGSPTRSKAKVNQDYQDTSDLEAWFDKIKGKHKIVFDAMTENEGHQVVFAYTFMMTNNKTGTPDQELSTLVVLRNKAIPLAMSDASWKKYKLGKMFKIIDMAYNATAERNLYWDPKEGEMPDPGMSIKALQARGVLFCVCETALTLMSKQYARSKSLDPAEVKKEWIAGLIPGIQLVPSGVWAINRAQEHGCSYCSAG